MTSRMIRWNTFALLTLAFGSDAATAQGAADFPSKPITVVIPTAASVSGDIIMRAYGEAVSKHLGQPIIVENKPGGSGALAAAYVATSVKPDGYTLLNITIPMYRVPHIQKTPYDPVKDFTPIILLGGYTLGGVVRADSPFKEWKDVLEFSKANPAASPTRRSARRRPMPSPWRQWHATLACSSRMFLARVAVTGSLQSSVATSTRW